MNTQKYNILWADDEIELLKPHILFLHDKGYEVTPVNNGAEAVELCTDQNFDIVFLDENMPGMTGLETLNKIKTNKPNLPVVMITKSEEEYIMEDAIGSKIDDYLIKPVNPKQILSSVKKILDNRRLVTEKTNLSYQQDFRQLSMVYNDRIGHEEWAEIYKKLVYWELEIERTENKSMKEVIEMQKDEANHNFTKFISDNYEKWLNNPDSDRPLMSHHLLRKKVLPMLQDKNNTAPLFFIVIDNLRYDQWRMIQPEIEKYFSIEEELPYYAILPTTTGYARNAIFSGMLPSEMEKYHSDIWINDEDEEGKNNNEQEFLKRQLAKNRIDTKFTYHKILNSSHGRDLLDKLPNLLKIPFNAVVFNFVDMLSHARTDTQVLRELAPDEAAYRSVTQSWFMHSQLLDLLRKLAENKARVVITTDHGTICVKKPYKIIGDKNVNTNLRYKQGKNLGFEDSDGILVCRKPERFFLPKANVSTAYVFATGNYFFAYPNNYNHYVSYYKDTFQHGGVSLEEIIVPLVTLKAK
jgi:CheY-like chemotaxis protein